MAIVSVFDMQGNEVGKMELNDAVFAAPINEHLLHLAVVAQLANRRQGTKKALTRAEVSGGGRKPWRQKETGHARQGSIRAPQWKGGGVVFAPTPRDYRKDLNKKEKRAALKAALSNAVADQKLVVVDSIHFDEIKTKKFQAMLDALKLKKAFVLLDQNDEKTILSARNIEDVKTAQVNEINVYDVMKYGTVLATKAALEKLEEVYA